MKTVLMVALLMLSFEVFSQEEDDIMDVVYDLFTAMETNDSVLAGKLFTNDAQLFTVFRNEQDQPQLRSNPANKLISAFGQPKEQKWSEPIWNEKLEIDGDFASVIVDYAFYIDKDFSHCGIDAFHLVKTPDGWKIFHLSDTRRKEDCQIPERIKKKYQ